MMSSKLLRNRRRNPMTEEKKNALDPQKTDRKISGNSDCAQQNEEQTMDKLEETMRKLYEDIYAGHILFTFSGFYRQFKDIFEEELSRAEQRGYAEGVEDGVNKLTQFLSPETKEKT